MQCWKEVERDYSVYSIRHTLVYWVYREFFKQHRLETAIATDKADTSVHVYYLETTYIEQTKTIREIHEFQDSRSRKIKFFKQRFLPSQTLVRLNESSSDDSIRSERISLFSNILVCSKSEKYSVRIFHLFPEKSAKNPFVHPLYKAVNGCNWFVTSLMCESYLLLFEYNTIDAQINSNSRSRDRSSLSDISAFLRTYMTSCSFLRSISDPLIRLSCRSVRRLKYCYISTNDT